ncbi:MAG: LIC12162 family protein [Bdellovibrionales bacterium]
MRLITTADPQFFGFEDKPNEPLLLLGEWCRDFASPEAFKGHPVQVLQHPWEDREVFHAAYKANRQAYQNLLPLFADALNEVHGLKWPLKSWRLIIGPWLQYTLGLLEDRQQLIQKATEQYTTLHTLVSANSLNDFRFNTFEHLFMDSLKDSFNHVLFATMAKENGHVLLENTPLSLVPTEKLKLGTSVSRLIKQNLNRTSRFFSQLKQPKLILHASYMSRSQEWDLTKRLGDIPTFLFPHVLEPTQSDLEVRSRFEALILKKSNSLSPHLIKLVPQSYLEVFQNLLKQTNDQLPQNPKAILTANGYYTNDNFKIWAAHQMQRGSKLIITQHGGHYGTGAWSDLEDHEKEIGDYYFTWGWSEEKEAKKLCPLPSPKLALSKKRIKTNSQKSLLVVWNSFPRYVYRMVPFPVAQQNLREIESGFRFFKKLDPRIYSQSKIRFYPSNFGWSEEKRFDQQFPDLKKSSSSIELTQAFSEASLVVTASNTTVFLEGLVSDVPTLAFWDDTFWPARESAKPYLEKLKQVGILHSSSESAAQKVNEIFDHPLDWWNSKEVVEAKNLFTQKFARFDENWINEWICTLQTIFK